MTACHNGIFRPSPQQLICYVADDNTRSVHNFVRVSERLRAPSGPTCVLCHSVVVNIDDDGLYHHLQSQKETVNNQHLAIWRWQKGLALVTATITDTKRTFKWFRTVMAYMDDVQTKQKRRENHVRQRGKMCAFGVKATWSGGRIAYRGRHKADNNVAKLLRSESMRMEIEYVLL